MKGAGVSNKGVYCVNTSYAQPFNEYDSGGGWKRMDDQFYLWWRT